MSLNVLRAAVILIVFTIAAGPSADLLCAIWCHPIEGTAHSCLHRETARQLVTHSDDCTKVTLRTTAFIREAMRRRPSVPDDTTGAAIITRFALAHSAGGGDRWSYRYAEGSVLGARVVTRPLRL